MPSRRRKRRTSTTGAGTSASLWSTGSSLRLLFSVTHVILGLCPTHHDGGRRGGDGPSVVPGASLGGFRGWRGEIWINRACAKCRAATALLDEAGADYTVRRYLDDSPTPEEL